MYTNADRLKTFCDNNLVQYLSQSRMEESGIWATDVEIMATATMLGCDAVVFAKFRHEMRWLRYPASLSLDQLSTTSIYLENLSDHFDVVLSVV